MTKRTVMKTVIWLDLRCSKCKKVALHTVTELEGIDSVKLDENESALIVIGDADPASMVKLLRKKSKCAHLISHGPHTNHVTNKPDDPKPPNTVQTNPNPKKNPEKCKNCEKCQCDKCKKPTCEKEKCKKCHERCKPTCEKECKNGHEKCKPTCEKEYEKCKCEKCKQPTCEKPCDQKCKCKDCEKPTCDQKCKCEKPCEKCRKCEKPCKKCKKCEKHPPVAPSTGAPAASAPSDISSTGAVVGPSNPPNVPNPNPKPKCEKPCVNSPTCEPQKCCPPSSACSCRSVEPCRPPACADSSRCEILWPRYHDPYAPDEVIYVWNEDQHDSCTIM